MSDEFAVFLNGVYERVLQDIADAQAHCPELVLYLQPYKSHRIARLAKCPPSPDNPVHLYASLTNDLNKIHFAGEIVGWEDKREMDDTRRHYVNKTIVVHQPTELGGVYATANGSECANLLQVRRLRRLDSPFDIESLVKLSDGDAPGERTQAGGWCYVEPVAREH